MVPKRDDVTTSYRQSDMHSSFIYSRDYKALLRSVGHLFRDGSWHGTEDDFQTYKVFEPPCLGKLNAFTFPSYERDGEGDYPGDPVPGGFKLCVTRGYDSSRYYGSIADRKLPAITDPDFSNFVLELNAQGTEWIERNRPGNPFIQFGQFIGELHDLPKIPILQSTGKSFLGKIGSEYLNIEFGWKPFLKDVVGAFEFQQRFQAYYDKLVKNNGISTPRRSKKKVDHVSPVVICSGLLNSPFGHLGDVSRGGNSALDGIFVGGPTGCADLDLYSFPGDCYYSYQVTDTTTTWNSGTFRYFVPDIGSEKWTARAKSVLSGAEVTPAMLWELMPWSWLIDWFTNVGNIISNASTNAVDNETLTNAFSMKTITSLHEIHISSRWDEITGSYGFHLPAGSDELVYTRTESHKLRHQASPFGFGVPSDSFTARQWAILAALAVSRK